MKKRTLAFFKLIGNGDKEEVTETSANKSTTLKSKNTCLRVNSLKIHLLPEELEIPAVLSKHDVTNNIATNCRHVFPKALV